MTISSIEISSPSAANAKIDFSALAHDPITRTENSEFGQIMSGIRQSSAQAQALTAGQKVAAQADLQPGLPSTLGGNLSASLGGNFLKAVHLGPYMNVITSEATAPNAQSLEAFARSQGLDETAVQWLMGSSPAIPVAPTMPPVQFDGAPAPQVSSLSALSLASQTPWMAPTGAPTPQVSSLSALSLASKMPGMEPIGAPAPQVAPSEAVPVATKMPPVALNGAPTPQVSSLSALTVAPKMPGMAPIGAPTPQVSSLSALTVAPKMPGMEPIGAPTPQVSSLSALTLAPKMSPVALNGSPAQQVTAPEATQPLTQTALLGALQTNTQPTKASGDISPPESLAQAIAASPVDSTSGGSENKPEMVGISKADASMLPYAMNAAALWAMTQATEKAQVTSPTAEDPSEAAKVQLNLMASAAPTAFWMLRNPMVATPSKEAPALPASIALSEIDLSQAATPELLESLSPSLAEGASLNTSAAVGDQAAPVTGHTGQRLELAVAVRQDPPNPQASAPAPDSGSAQRSENVQNLAEKMGQAVGQRILSEIEKGQWHLKLMLRPATLGHIEVEMRMRSGELDAVFTAPQAVTRELLQEGLSKLKDTLNQMGMDVASMQVGDGQSQKRGGESTSKQMSKSTKDNSDDPKSSTSAVKTPTARTKMGQDGWDVLV